MVVASYVFGALGLALAAARVVVVLRITLNHDAFTAHLVKLVRAGNRDRAIKLATVVPWSTCARVSRAVLVRSAEIEGAAWAELMADDLNQTLQRAYSAEMRRLAWARWLGVPALACAAVALVFGLSLPAAPQVFALPALTAIGVVWSWRQLAAVASGSLRCGEQVVEVLVGQASAR
jgi:hypothetical protein